jgi:hypothetical protein
MALAHPYRCVLKREYYRGMGAADTCGELQQLKRQYEFALRVWGAWPVFRFWRKLNVPSDFRAAIKRAVEEDV